jgi:hypothetical protein
VHPMLLDAKLQRVEYLVNPALDAAHGQKKREMTARLGAAGVNERLLFHGTTFANSEGIARENFRLDKVGRAQTFFTSFIRLPGVSPQLSGELVLCQGASTVHNSHLTALTSDTSDSRYRNVGECPREKSDPPTGRKA